MLENIERQKSIYNTKLAELDKATKEKEELSSKLTVLENSLNALLEEDVLLVSKEKNIDEQLRTGYNFKSNLENRKKFLEDQINNLSFYNIGVKEILSNKETIGGVHNSVANIINFGNEYATALDIALGQSQQNIVVDSEATAKKCIEYLKKSNKGRVTFLPLNNIKAKSIASDIYSILVKEEGFINIAENLIAVNETYKNIISHLLGLTIIVDNMDNANRIARRINFRNRIITLDGQVINSGGSITGGAINKNNNSSIKHKAELDNLEDNLGKINDKVSKLETEKTKLEAKERVCRKHSRVEKC